MVFFSPGCSRTFHDYGDVKWLAAPGGSGGSHTGVPSCTTAVRGYSHYVRSIEIWVLWPVSVACRDACTSNTCALLKTPLPYPPEISCLRCLQFTPPTSHGGRRGRRGGKIACTSAIRGTPKLLRDGWLVHVMLVRCRVEGPSRLPTVGAFSRTAFLIEMVTLRNTRISSCHDG